MFDPLLSLTRACCYERLFIVTRSWQARFLTQMWAPGFKLGPRPGFPVHPHHPLAKPPSMARSMRQPNAIASRTARAPITVRRLRSNELHHPSLYYYLTVRGKAEHGSVATFERYMWLVSCGVERYTLVTDGYYASFDIGNVYTGHERSRCAV